MFRSLQMKLVLILFILIFSVMSVLGIFMLNSVTKFYFEEFNKQIHSVFTTDVLRSLENQAKNEDILQVKAIMDAYSGSLGIDSDRNYYILDGNTLKPLVSSTNDTSTNINVTPNISAALVEGVGFKNRVSQDFLDFAVSINEAEYIIYIRDNKQEINDLTWMLFGIMVQAMLLGLIVAIFLSFILSKTMTTPIENLTRGAIKRASGDFTEPIEVHSKDEIGILTDTFNSMSDILERTLEQVKEEKDKLATLFLHMTDGVLSFTKEGNIINMNLKAEEMIQTEFHENLKFSDLFSDMKLPYVNENEETLYIETSIERKNAIYKVLFAPFGDFSEEDSGIIVVMHDITEERKLEDARREFVSNVSHELRTPLTNIKSYTETILENKEYLDAQTEDKFLKIIAGETDRMARIVKDLLTLSKLDHGKMDLSFENVNLEDVLQTSFNAFILEASNADISINLDIKSKLLDIYGDKGRLEQVFTNIISNAIKYTQKGGNVLIEASMQEKNSVSIIIRDNGYGIPKEDLSRIFERFYRVDKARSRDKGGTGLGLSIAKNIVEIHGGSIKIDSEVDVGTTVKIIIPCAKPSEGRV